MRRTARLLPPLAVACCLLGACRHVRPARPPPPPAAAGANLRGIAPSPRMVVGRVLAIDPQRKYVFVDVGMDAPPAALAEGTELTTRTMDLRDTAQLRVSRYVRGRTLGTTVISGQPSPGDEVVWPAP